MLARAEGSAGDGYDHPGGSRSNVGIAVPRPGIEAPIVNRSYLIFFHARPIGEDGHGALVLFANRFPKTLQLFPHVSQ